MKIILAINDKIRKELEELNSSLAYNCSYLIDNKGKTIGILLNVDWSMSFNENLRQYL